MSDDRIIALVIAVGLAAGVAYLIIFWVKLNIKVNEKINSDECPHLLDKSILTGKKICLICGKPAKELKEELLKNLE